MIDNHRYVYLSRKESELPWNLWFDMLGKYGGDIQPNEIKLIAEFGNTEVFCGFKSSKFSTFCTTNKEFIRFSGIYYLENFITRCKQIIEMHWNREITDKELFWFLKYLGRIENREVTVTQAADVAYVADVISGYTWRKIRGIERG